MGLVALRMGMWDLSSWQVIEPKLPALSGGFLSTGLPGK